MCRVDGTPSSDPCVNTPPSDAYWSLWWSDGKSGTWSYSSAGVASLKVPAGGYVALSWQGAGGRAAPRTAPTPHPTAPPSPTHPDLPPHGSSDVGAADASGLRAGSVPPHVLLRAGPAPPSGRSAGRRSHGPASTRADLPPNRSATEPGSGSGLPGWVAPGVVALLFVAAAAVAVVRRKRSGGA